MPRVIPEERSYRISNKLQRIQDLYLCRNVFKKVKCNNNKNTKRFIRLEVCVYVCVCRRNHGFSSYAKTCML
jgi:hypothetical protein